MWSRNVPQADGGALQALLFSPPPSEVMQRFCFYKRARQQKEVVAAFLAELRKHCNFVDSVETALRDCMIGRINDKAIRKKLLGEKNLTFQQKTCPR